MLGNGKYNIGYDGDSFSSNQSGLSSQAIAWRAAILSAGGTIATNILTIIDNNLIKPMVSSGIFACLDRMNLYAGTGNQTASLINIVNPSLYNLVVLNSANAQWLNTSGWRSTITTANSGGTLYGAYAPSTAAKWSADRFNNGQFTMMLNPLNTASNTNMSGYGTGASTKYVATDRTNTQGLRIFSNSNTVALNGSFVTTGKVWCAGFRSANNVSVIVNSTSVTTSVTPLATIPSGDIYELSVAGQTNIINYDTSYHMASGHGNGNYDNQLLKTYLLNTFTALGI